MNNNLRMSGVMYLMLRRSADRRQQDALEAAFRKADVNGDGFLSADEYHAILKDHGVECSREEILQIMQMADKDGDGLVSRDEFVGSRRGSHKEPVPPLSAQARAQLAFNKLDQNHDGFVTKGEMMRGSGKLTQAQVDAVFQLNDEDQDGRLSLGEFQGFMQQHSRSKARTQDPPAQ